MSWGILAFRRALESPKPARLVHFGAIVALLLYTQYWALYLLLVVAVLLVVLAWRGTDREAARRMLLAMAIAGLAFIPWLPTFLYQRAHTGTPWGTPLFPGVPFGYTLRDFAEVTSKRDGSCSCPLLGFLLLGLFGRATDERRIEVDLHTNPVRAGKPSSAGRRWRSCSR